MDIELNEFNTLFVEYELCDYDIEGYYFIMKEKPEFNSKFLLNNMNKAVLFFAGSYVVLDIVGEYFAFDTEGFFNLLQQDFFEKLRPFSFVFEDDFGQLSQGMTIINE
jgi:hypothetical protein